MKYSQVIDLISESEMTFEEIAPVIGVSGMTLRRWAKRNGNSPIPHKQQCAIREGLHRLLIDGKVKGNSKSVKALLTESPSISFEAALKSLGVSDLSFSKGLGNQDQMTMVLAEIGQNRKHVSEVDRSQAAILKFKSFGESWARNISILVRVIRSKDIFALDKIVAYGALFYLIFPVDLIPDSLPVVGYLDDFAFLAIAVAFYLKKFPVLGEALAE